jgi:hypothetical protein
MKSGVLFTVALVLILTYPGLAQEEPIAIADNIAQGKTGTWSNLTMADRTAIAGEAAAGALNATSSIAIKSVQHWTGSFKYAPTGEIYPYTMIGTNPFKNPVSSTVPVAMIPLQFVFDAYLVNGHALVFSPSSKLGLLKASPLWAAHNYGFGSAQYIDSLQRNSFSRTNGYHVRLGTARMISTYTVHLSASNGKVYQTSKGYVGVVDINFLLNLVSTLPPKLGVKSNELAVMVSNNVYGAQLSGTSFYYYGYHGITQISSTSTSQTEQVWAWSSWIGPGWFGNTHTLDITGLTHEVAEVANDPFLSNFAPNYELNGSCTDIIEVGDVTEGLLNDAMAVSVNGYTYHVANVAMIPWFSRTAATTTTKSYSFPSTSLLTTASPKCQ